MKKYMVMGVVAAAVLLWWLVPYRLERVKAWIGLLFS
jgi:hypothetical protein